MKKWFVVHDIDSYSINSRVLGFDDTTHNVEKISIGDKVIYYHNGNNMRGIYEVTGISQPPAKYESSWNSDYQICINPIFELNSCLLINKYIDQISIFSNKEYWGSSIMGVNAVRLLTYDDFDILENAIYQHYKYEQEMCDDFEERLISTMKLSLEELSQKIDCSSSSKRQKYIMTKKYNRCPYVVAYTLKRADGICEICGKQAPFNRKSNGSPYLEIHHTKALSDGGEDSINNTKAICPNCHAEVHYGE